jgi:predicted DNA-binding protein
MKAKEKSKIITIALDPDTSEKFDRMKETTGVSGAAIVRLLIQEHHNARISFE